MTTRLTKHGILRWAYSQPNTPISYLANIIQCQCGCKATYLHGLYNLVQAGHEVCGAQFDLFGICIDGARFEISKLAEYAVEKVAYDNRRQQTP